MLFKLRFRPREPAQNWLNLYEVILNRTSHTGQIRTSRHSGGITLTNRRCVALGARPSNHSLCKGIQAHEYASQFNAQDCMSLHTESIRGHAARPRVDSDPR